MISALPLVLGLGRLVTLGTAVSAADCPIRLVDVTAESGIDFKHTDGSSGP